MNLWIKLKPQSFLGHRTARIILGFNHYQKIVNMLLSTRQTRRWAFSVRSMDVIGIQCNFKFLFGRWTLINMTCAEDEWTDSWTSTSRLDRIVRMTKPEERQIIEYIVIYVRKASRYWCSLVSPLAGILIYEIFFFCVYSSERRETLCTLNSPNLTMKLMPPNHQNHPAMSLRYTLMWRDHPLSCLVERIQTPHSQHMRILKRLVSEWDKYT